MISAYWKPVWRFFNIGFLPVFVFKQVVSLVALFDSSKSIIQLDEDERRQKTE